MGELVHLNKRDIILFFLQTSVSTTNISVGHRYAHTTVHAHAELNIKEVSVVREKDQEEEREGGVQTTMTNISPQY